MFKSKMSVINFSIPQTLNEKIQKTIKDQGFASKAEFFRFAAIYLMQDFKHKSGNNEYEKAMGELASALKKRIGNKQLPSLEDQFADL